MSGYDRIAVQIDEAEEDELDEIQIEELNNLMEYDYFWKGFWTLGWNNFDCFNRKCGPINTIDKAIKGEYRWLLYLLFLPFIILFLILSLIKRIIVWFIELPNGKRK